MVIRYADHVWRTISRTCSFFQIKILSAFNNNSPCFLEPASGSYHSNFCLSENVLGTWYKWKHAMFLPLCLTYFIKYNVTKVHSCHGMCWSFLLFQGWAISKIHVHFAYPFMNHGYLGCLHLLAIVSAMNTDILI